MDDKSWLFRAHQKTCCDPLKCHKKPVKTSLRVVSKELAAETTSGSLVPGQKICTNCVKKLQAPAAARPEESDSLSSDPDAAGTSGNQSRDIEFAHRKNGKQRLKH